MCIVIPHYRIKGASDQLSDQGASRLAPGTLQWSAVLHNNQGLQQRARVATCHRYRCSLAGGFTGGGGLLDSSLGESEEWREKGHSRTVLTFNTSPPRRDTRWGTFSSGDINAATRDT